METAIVFGEALIDCFPDRRVVAGAPLHVAVHLAGRGWRAALVSRVGPDEDGEAIRRLLGERGVDLSLLETDQDLPTGTVTVGLREGGHSFTIHGPAAWDAIAGPAELPPHELLCYTGLAGRAEMSRRTLARLLEMSDAPLRCFDLTFRPPDVHPEAVHLGVLGATLLKGSQEELEELVELLGRRPPPGGCFDASPGLQWVCMTRGSSGASLWERSGGEWSVAARPVEVVDTVGAGDAFTAGLVDALARGREPEPALEQAAEAAASIVGRRGGLPPA